MAATTGKDTHHSIDAILAQRSLGHYHQVGLNAPLLQVLAAVSTIPWFHIKLSMQTFEGILGDVYSPIRHNGKL